MTLNYQSRRRFFQLLAIGVGGLALPELARAQSTVTLDATDSGLYDDRGFHDSDYKTYTAGYFAATGSTYDPSPHEYRTFLTFDLASLNRPVTAATLQLSNPAGGFFSANSASETVDLAEVSNNLATVRANQSNARAVFNDLAQGVTYGSFAANASWNNTVRSLPMTAGAVTGINERRGGGFGVGISLSTIGPGTGGEYVFGGSDSTSTRRLVLSVADNVAWQNAGGGLWSTSANWQYGFVPSSATDANFALGSTFTVNVASPATARAVAVSNGNVTINFGVNQTLSASDLRVYSPGASPTLNLTGPGAVNVSGQTLVGAFATPGFLYIRSGATLNTASTMYIAEGGGLGSVMVEGGGSVLNGGGGIYIGSGASSSGGGQTGNLTVSNGGKVTAIDVISLGQGNASTNAQLYVRAGGRVEAGSVHVYNSRSNVYLEGGTLKVGSLDVDGSAFRFQWRSGTLELAGGRIESFGTNLLGVPSLGTLVGNGTVAPTVFLDSQSILSPGASTGALALEQNLLVGASAILKWEFSDSIADIVSGSGPSNVLTLQGGVDLQLFSLNGATFRSVTLFTGFETINDLLATDSWRVRVDGVDVNATFTYDPAAGSLSVGVPEPATLSLLAFAGIVVRRRR